MWRQPSPVPSRRASLSTSAVRGAGRAERTGRGRARGPSHAPTSARSGSGAAAAADTRRHARRTGAASTGVDANACPAGSEGEAPESPAAGGAHFRERRTLAGTDRACRRCTSSVVVADVAAVEVKVRGQVSRPQRDPGKRQRRKTRAHYPELVSRQARRAPRGGERPQVELAGQESTAPTPAPVPADGAPDEEPVAGTGPQAEPEAPPGTAPPGARPAAPVARDSHRAPSPRDRSPYAFFHLMVQPCGSVCGTGGVLPASSASMASRR